MFRVDRTDRAKTERASRRPYTRPQVRDYHLRPEHLRVLDSWRWEAPELRTINRFIQTLRDNRVIPEEVITRLEIYARKERLDLDNIRISEANLIFFFGRVLEREGRLDPLDLLHTLIPQRSLEGPLEIPFGIESLRDADSRIAAYSPSEVRSIVDLLRRHPELKELLARRLGLDKLKGLHEWNVLRLIIHGLLEYRAEIGRAEFDRRYRNGLPTALLIESAELSLLHKLVNTPYHWLSPPERHYGVTLLWDREWRVIRSAYLRNPEIRAQLDTFTLDSKFVDRDNFLAGLRARRIDRLELEHVTVKYGSMITLGELYLRDRQAIAEGRMTVNQLFGDPQTKRLLPVPTVQALIDSHPEVDIFGPTFAHSLLAPSDKRETHRLILKGTLNDDIPGSPRPYAHDELLGALDHPASYEAREEALYLLKESPQALFFALRYYAGHYSPRSNIEKSEVGNFILDALEKAVDPEIPQEELVQTFKNVMRYISSEMITGGEVRLHREIMKAVQDILVGGVAKGLPEVISFVQDAEYFSDSPAIYRPGLMGKLLTWEAQGYAALLSAVREFLPASELDQLFRAHQAAETLRRLLGSENPAKPLIHYLPAFAAMRIGGELRERALDEFKTVLRETGGHGLLAALDVVQGIARGEIYTDVENILKEVDLIGLEPEVKIFGALLRSERLQQEHQENLFYVARSLLAAMPHDFLMKLIDLVDTGQYEEVGVRVKEWLEGKTRAELQQALEAGEISFSEITDSVD